jgi:hypothetical protein
MNYGANEAELLTSLNWSRSIIIQAQAAVDQRINRLRASIRDTEEILEYYVLPATNYLPEANFKGKAAQPPAQPVPAAKGKIRGGANEDEPARRFRRVAPIPELRDALQRVRLLRSVPRDDTINPEAADARRHFNESLHFERRYAEREDDDTQLEPEIVDALSKGLAAQIQAHFSDHAMALLEALPPGEDRAVAMHAAMLVR